MENTLINLERIATIGAFVSAAGFFIWKIMAGWLIANLEIAIETERQAKDETTDWLSIKILLKKGNTDALWLKDISVKVSDIKRNEGAQIIQFHEFKSLSVINGEINWDNVNEHIRKYAIAPGEIFQFGCVLEVSNNVPLIVEAAVFGNRRFWRRGFQWRASTASLPVKKSKN